MIFFFFLTCFTRMHWQGSLQWTSQVSPDYSSSNVYFCRERTRADSYFSGVTLFICMLWCCLDFMLHFLFMSIKNTAHNRNEITVISKQSVQKYGLLFSVKTLKVKVLFADHGGICSSQRKGAHWTVTAPKSRLKFDVYFLLVSFMRHNLFTF